MTLARVTLAGQLAAVEINVPFFGGLVPLVSQSKKNRTLFTYREKNQVLPTLFGKNGCCLNEKAPFRTQKG